MILTKLMILTLIIANVLSMTKDFHLLILGQVITKTKLRMYFFCNLMFCVYTCFAMYYFYTHSKIFKPVGEWELWMYLVLCCIYMLNVSYIYCCIKKHINSIKYW
jgi:hypothetical protein